MIILYNYSLENLTKSYVFVSMFCFTKLQSINFKIIPTPSEHPYIPSGKVPAIYYSIPLFPSNLFEQCFFFISNYLFIYIYFFIIAI